MATATAPRGQEKCGVDPKAMLRAMEESGTPEEMLIHMLEKLDADPNMDCEQLLSILESDLSIARGAARPAFIAEGTLAKMRHVMRGEAIPVVPSRMSQMMRNNLGVQQPGQTFIAPYQPPSVLGPVDKDAPSAGAKPHVVGPAKTDH